MHTKKRSRYAYLFIAPFFIAFITFSLYPIFYSLYISFSKYDALTGKAVLTGWNNYKRLLESGYFFNSFVNTFIIWIFSIIPQLSIALLLALLLDNSWIKGRNTLRSIYYFPHLVTPVTIGLLFGILFSHPGGTMNLLIKGLGMEAVNFEQTPFLAMLVVSLATCWQNFGYNVIFFTAGLNSIPADVYEAAEVDGANQFQKTFKITLPLMKPILVYVMITSIIGGLQIFDVAKIVFKNVPGDRTTTMVKYMYESAFERWQLDYGAANAYGIFFIIAVFSLISLKLTSGRKARLEKMEVAR